MGKGGTTAACLGELYIYMAVDLGSGLDLMRQERYSEGTRVFLDRCWAGGWSIGSLAQVIYKIYIPVVIVCFSTKSETKKMPFSVSLSFSSTRHPSSMPPSPFSSSSSLNSRSPMSFGAKRPGPIGLWKSRKHRHAAAPLHPEHRSSTPGSSDSDSDKDSCSFLASDLP